METIDKIMQETGKAISECKCYTCASHCKKTPCIGTPEDMEKLVNAGYSNRLAAVGWGVGKLYGITDKIIPIIAPRFDVEKGSCTFFNDGLCELHEKGLKPTEGKLSSHTTETFSSIEEFKKNSIAWSIIKYWI